MEKKIDVVMGYTELEDEELRHKAEMALNRLIFVEMLFDVFRAIPKNPDRPDSRKRRILHDYYVGKWEALLAECTTPLQEKNCKEALNAAKKCLQCYTPSADNFSNILPRGLYPTAFYTNQYASLSH